MKKHAPSLRLSHFVAPVLISGLLAISAHRVNAQGTPPAASPATMPSSAGLLIANGNFDLASQNPQLPDGWTNEKDGLVSLESEGDRKFIRLVSTGSGQLIQISQPVSIPAGVKGLDVFARFRTANVKFGGSFLNDARTRFQFVAADGQVMKAGVPDVIFNSHAKDWTEIKRGFLVPEGAARIVVMLCINKAASGTLDVDEVRVTPMDPAAAEALAMAPVLAAKKKAEDEAEVQRLLALPPKTPEIKVSGNKLVTATGSQVRLQGVNVCSLEWSEKGENVLRSMKVSLVDWKANTIRLPVKDNFWFGQGNPPKTTSNDAEAYRKIVDDAIAIAAGQGAYVVLDLHRFNYPEERDVLFWKDAAARYKNNPAVLFDIFNEPAGIGWDVWRHGGEVKTKQKNSPEPLVTHSTGMQALVDAVRGTGAKNIIIAGGLSHAYNLDGILNGYLLDDKAGNGIMYATHFYNWHRNWEKAFLFLAEQYPIFVGETGADIKKMPFVPAKHQEDPYTFVPDALAMIQKYNLNWTAFCMHPKSTPVLITNWDYEPSPFWGAFVKRALAGEKFELTRMR